MIRSGSAREERANFTRLVLGYVEADLCKYIVHTYLKALAEIYTIHTFAQISGLKISID